MSENALTTTGQVDWTAIGRTSISVSLEVASRLANANVDVVTFGVGRILGSQFVFPPKGQKELMSSLSQLKGISSFSETLWFGFGVKHVVRTLVETEQGAMCVALCAVMATMIPAWHTATILRDMCSELDTPPEWTPSIHQWQNLVEVCQGSMQRSHFLSIHEHFHRLLVRDNNKEQKSEGGTKTFARALLALARISRGELRCITLVGGYEAALLAAIAECLLDLAIEIRDGQDDIAYFNCAYQPVQAIFRATAVHDSNASSALQIQSTTFYVSGGAELFDRHRAMDPLYEMQRRNICTYSAPTTWSTYFRMAILCWNKFHEPKVSHALIDLLSNVLSCTVDYSISDLRMREGLRYTMTLTSHLQLVSRTGLETRSATPLPTIALQRVQNLFPELKGWIGEILEANEKPSDTNKCLLTLKSACDCLSCSEGRTYGAAINTVCIWQASLVVCTIAAVLSPLQLDIDACTPSVSGVSQFYRRCWPAVCPVPMEHMEAVTLLLTGHSTSIGFGKDRICAVTKSGITIYRPLLEDPTMAIHSTSLLRVIPGHISFRHRPYKRIIDASRVLDVVGVSDGTFNLRQPIRLAVEETESSADLRAWYETQPLSGTVRTAGPQLIAMLLEAALFNGLFVDKAFYELSKISVTLPREMADVGAPSLHEQLRWALMKPASADHYLIHPFDPQASALGDAYGHLRSLESGYILRCCPCTPCVLTKVAKVMYRSVDRDDFPLGGKVINSLAQPPTVTAFTYKEKDGFKTAASGETIIQYSKRTDALIRVFNGSGFFSSNVRKLEDWSKGVAGSSSSRWK